MSSSATSRRCQRMRWQQFAHAVRTLVPVSLIAALSISAAQAGEFAWQPGHEGCIPFLPAVHSVLDFGAAGDGVTDDSGSFQDALDALPAAGGAVWVPPGTYLLRSTLRLTDGAILRGGGAAVTHLRFDLGGRSDNAIEALKYGRGPWVVVGSGHQKGSSEIFVEDGSSFSIPTFAEIQQRNDPDVMFTNPNWDQFWADDAAGELVRVIGKVGNRLILAEPLRFTYDPAMEPVIRSQSFVEDVGIEHLHITRLDDGDGYTIFFKNTAWAWVREVEMEMTVRAHVHTDTVYGCEIRDSYLHHAHGYGGGGNGYGVEFSRHTTNCLVENNIFSTLRHSMMVHIGANGNVFGYNYSRDATAGSNWYPPDISLHGHSPFANLFEGNVVQEIGVGDYWGPAGPDNTIFRNCIQNEGIEILDHSHGQILIGNTLIGGAQNQIYIDPTVQNTTVHGNYVNGAVQWDPGNPDHEIPDSRYVSDRPWFFEAAQAWPSIGGDLGPLCSNPALSRWDNGGEIPSVTPILADGFENGTLNAWEFSND